MCVGIGKFAFGIEMFVVIIRKVRNLETFGVDFEKVS